jgi:hypothetical protein
MLEGLLHNLRLQVAEEVRHLLAQMLIVAQTHLVLVELGQIGNL